MALIPDDLAFNRQERCPVVLALDVSSSMVEENRIELLNEALVQFRDELNEDKLASLRVELAVVTFGSSAEMIQDFVIAADFKPPHLVANGTTAMGQAMDIAVAALDDRKAIYRTSGVKYFRPWIWLMSDGGANDDGWEAAADRAIAAENSKKVKVFAVGIGAGADLASLGRFSSAQPLRVEPGMFKAMFKWLSVSLQLKSNSVPLAEPDGEQVAARTTRGEQIKTPPVGWATVD